MAENGIRRKLAWLILIRAAISTILLGSATFVQITRPGSFPGNPFFALIGLTFALTITYATTLRFVERNRWLIDLQLAGDALIVSAFIYFTGVIDDCRSPGAQSARHRQPSERPRDDRSVASDSDLQPCGGNDHRLPGRSGRGPADRGGAAASLAVSGGARADATRRCAQARRP